MYSIYDGSGCNECVHVVDFDGSLMAPNYHFRVSDNGRSHVRTGESSSMNQINLQGWVSTMKLIQLKRRWFCFSRQDWGKKKKTTCLRERTTLCLRRRKKRWRSHHTVKQSIMTRAEGSGDHYTHKSNISNTLTHDWPDRQSFCSLLKYFSFCFSI